MKRFKSTSLGAGAFSALVFVLAMAIGALVPSAATASPSEQLEARPIAGLRVADCEETCKRHYEKALQRCERAGGDDCEARARKAYEDCLERCENSRGEPGIRPDDPLRCEEACRKRAIEAYNTCREEGNEDCIGVALTTFADCLRHCDTPEPPPSNCEAKCKRHAQEVLERCRATGTSDNCEAKAEAALKECVALNCERDDDPPKEPGCEAECRRAANAFRQECLDNGRDPAVCAHEAKAKFDICIREHCGHDPEPPKEPGCEARCQQKADEQKRECVANGGNPEECAKEARQVFERCVEENCRPDKPEPEPECRALCEKHAAEVKRECMAAGHGAEACAERAREAFERCVERECEPGEPEPEPEPEPGCEDKCEQRADDFERTCVSNGGNPEECAKEAHQVFERCVVQHCRPDRPEPNCEQRCEEKAALVKQECMAAGHGADACGERARQAYELCVERECEPGDPEPGEPEPSCEDKCHHRAEVYERECVADGGNPEACAKEARQVFERCVEENCEPDKPEPSCEQRCEDHAAEVKKACMEAGHGADDCAARARQAFEDCVEENCEPDCKQACENHANEIKKACMEAGGSAEDCAARARDAFEDCVERECDPELSCENRCKIHSLEVERECLEGGGGQDRCGALARQAYEDCVEENCRRDEPVRPLPFLDPVR